MSLVISNGQIGTTPPVSFPNKSIVISSAGIGTTDNSGSITLNTGSSLNISQANGIVTPSGLSLAPITTAPSASSSGFSVSGSVAGVVPPAPTITSVALGSSAGQVLISFTLSSIDCGESISGVTFISYIGGVEQGSSILNGPFTLGQSSSAYFNGLTAGQTYTFRMYASTASVAQGDLSNESPNPAIQVGSVPGAPTFAASGLLNSNGTWYIQWYAPSDGGLAIDYEDTEIDIQYGGTSISGAPFINEPGGPWGGSYYNAQGYSPVSPAVPILPPVSGTYSFYVRVRNAIGYGPWSLPTQINYTYTPPSTSVAGAWVQFDMGSAMALSSYYCFNFNAGHMTSWTIVGSNDASSWNFVDSRDNVNIQGGNTFTVSSPYNNNVYRYWRWIARKTTDTGFIFAHQFQWYRTGGGTFPGTPSASYSTAPGDRNASNSSTNITLDLNYSWQSTSNYSSQTYGGPNATTTTSYNT